jgi:hypothetical protein
MSDEHKRQTEYWARAATDFGWPVEVEKRPGTRPDALIYGTVLTGVEVRLSRESAASAVARTHNARRAGVTDLWFTASDIQTIGGRYRPLWAHRVPTVGSVRIPWNELPRRRSATATGLRNVRRAWCTVTEFDRCPYYPGRGPSHCGEPHPKPEPLRGLTVDDVAGQFPAGEIVALIFDGYQRRDDVFLVRRADVATYEELTGRPALLAFKTDARAATRFGASPAAWLPPQPAGTCLAPGCDRPARLYAGGWRCDQHLALPHQSEHLGKLPPEPR